MKSIVWHNASVKGIGISGTQELVLGECMYIGWVTSNYDEFAFSSLPHLFTCKKYRPYSLASSF